jgi:carboxylesterase 1
LLTDEGGDFLHPFQTLPENLIPVVIEKYLGGTDDPIKNRAMFLDLIADMGIGIPSVIVSRGHRGKF